MPKGNPVSFRLSSEAIRVLEAAESKLAMKRSAAVELALRAFDRVYLREPKKSRKKSEVAS